MTKKKNDNNDRLKREVDFQLIAKIVLVIAIIGIGTTTILIFTPPIGGEGYAELAIVTYNESLEKYEAYNYPTQAIYNRTTGQSTTISLFFIVSNHFEEVKYFEVRLKIGLQAILIDENNFADNDSSYFYKDCWRQRILSNGEYWGPSDETKIVFSFSSNILSKLGENEAGYKIIFELWEWNSSIDDFAYSGLYVYLTAFQLIFVT